ncbi:MAG: Holliday junction branch migration protein RuvA [Victivallaceae bacterium]|nr:Holliday junction branch migration protein RuvA [Victivallaceae bacterium]
MIGFLSGKLLETDLNGCLLDVNGVGYEVAIPLSTYDKLPKPGGELQLFIHTDVKEDAIHLFGFATREEKRLFRILIEVSGIGGKTALNILGAMPVPNFCAAILSDDHRALAKISGIGKRTAERLVVELRDKLKGFDTVGFSIATGARSPKQAYTDAQNALEQLGFKRDRVVAVLDTLEAQLPEDADSETILRAAIAGISGRS